MSPSFRPMYVDAGRHPVAANVHDLSRVGPNYVFVLCRQVEQEGLRPPRPPPPMRRDGLWISQLLSAPALSKFSRHSDGRGLRTSTWNACETLAGFRVGSGDLDLGAPLVGACR